MHQTLELLAKAIYTDAYPQTLPRRFSHKTLKLMQEHQEIDVFKQLVSDVSACELLTSLEQAYLQVRYAESTFSLVGDSWVCFRNTAGLLFSDLGRRLNLEYPEWYPEQPVA